MTTTYLKTQLAEWKLRNDFSSILQEAHAFIAGSFVLKCVTREAPPIPMEFDQTKLPAEQTEMKYAKSVEWMANDIDIWLPSVTDHINQMRDLLKLINELIEVGYSFPRKVSRARNVPENYARLFGTISDIYICKLASEGKTIQILVLKPNILPDPQQIVSNFDFTICQMWYDGTTIGMTDRAKEDVQTHTLRFDMTSQDVKKQSLVEWYRSFQRMQKYLVRGFILSDEKAPWETFWNLIVKKQGLDIKKGISDFIYNLPLFNLGHGVSNRYKFKNKPFIMLTLKPSPGRKSQLRDIHIVFIQPAAFEARFRIPYKSLTDAQKKTMVPLFDSSAHDTFLLFEHGTKKAEIDIRTFLTVETTIATHFLRLPPPTCRNIIDVEDVESKEFLQENENHVILMVPTITGQLLSTCWNKLDLSENVRTYYECLYSPGLFVNSEAVIKEAYFRIDLETFPIFIPHENWKFFEKSMAKYFVVHETEKRMRLTVSQEFLIDGYAVSADHCQEGSDKPISLLEPVEISEIGELTLLPQGANRAVNE